MSTHGSNGDEGDTEEPQSFGMSEDCMEKPWFPNLETQTTKRPFILSKPGVRPVIEIPATINRYLRGYQRDGVQFLYNHFAENHGAILGDDMGLGKTIQVIAFIAAIQGKTGTKLDVKRQQPSFIREMYDDPAVKYPPIQRKPFLIIGPASVLYNWEDELHTWGHFKIGKFHRQFKDETISLLQRNKLDVVVTTFETCREHIKVLNTIEWEAVIADEAHKIKNLKAGTSQALNSFSCIKRYGLTGTPLQNNLAEFWCIMNWANPNCLGKLKSFYAKYVDVIEEGQKHDATKRQLAEARAAQDKLGKVRTKWLLRRTKALIADQLPKKEELVVYCPMAQLQADIYKTIMESENMQFILTSGQKCTCRSGATRRNCCYKKTPDGLNIRALMFSYMHLLLKTANHVALLLPKNTTSEKQAEHVEELCSKVFERHQQFLEQTKVASFRTLSDPKYCGKMKVLAGLLSVFRKRRSKVLLFSYSTRLLDILEQYMMTQSFEYRRLDGTTPDAKRTQIVKDFNRDKDLFVFLISTKAGGIGLNLTGANVVIIFDPNWNPTHDLQAQDRAYRLGQLRDVKVYRLICVGTIEENIYLRQVYKQQHANQAVDSEYSKRYFNEGELFGVENMFRLRQTERTLTEELLSRQRRVEEGLKALRIENYIASPESSGEEEGQQLTRETEFHHSQEPSTSSGITARQPSKQRKRTSQVHIPKLHVDTDNDPYDNNSDDSEDTNIPYTKLRKKNVRENVNATKKNRDLVSDEVCHSGKLKKEHFGSSQSDEEPAARVERQRSTHYQSVTDVFEDCGVVHTHKNREIVGGSRVEDHMSKAAMRDVFELHQFSQMPAFDCEPYVQSSPESDDPTKSKKALETRPKEKPEMKKKRKTIEMPASWSEMVGDQKVLGGQTPKAIQMKHFEGMSIAQSLKTVHLARHVLLANQEERLELLRNFYTSQDSGLKNIAMERLTLPVALQKEKTSQRLPGKQSQTGLKRTKARRETGSTLYRTHKPRRTRKPYQITYADSSASNKEEQSQISNALASAGSHPEQDSRSPFSRGNNNNSWKLNSSELNYPEDVKTAEIEINSLGNSPPLLSNELDLECKNQIANKEKLRHANFSSKDNKLGEAQKCKPLKLVNRGRTKLSSNELKGDKNRCYIEGSSSDYLFMHTTESKVDRSDASFNSRHGFSSQETPRHNKYKMRNKNIAAESDDFPSSKYHPGANITMGEQRQQGANGKRTPDRPKVPPRHSMKNNKRNAAKADCAISLMSSTATAGYRKEHLPTVLSSAINNDTSGKQANSWEQAKRLPLSPETETSHLGGRRAMGEAVANKSSGLPVESANNRGLNNTFQFLDDVFFSD